MTVTRSIFAVLAMIAAAAALGALCALTWITHLMVIVQVSMGIACLLFMVWPVGALLLIGPRLAVFTALCLAVAVTLLSVPVFAETFKYFVRAFVGVELGRTVWGVAYMCAFACALFGIVQALWRARLWLFRNKTIGALLGSGAGLVVMIAVVVMYGF